MSSKTAVKSSSSNENTDLHKMTGNLKLQTTAKLQADEERLKIVKKYYDKSYREEDDWVLNADSKIFRMTDRYGFLHEQNNNEKLMNDEDKRRTAEVKRQDKWLKMILAWKKFDGTEKLKKRVYKGVPLRFRGDIWKLLLKVQQYIEKKPKLYQKAKTVALQTSPDVRQVDLDVNRTYRDHIMFRERYSEKQQQLFHVLVAYSMYNTEVGYCQGMSQIAALLLMFMGEEEAFWALHSLLYGKQHSMHGFFIPGFPKLMRFQQHHDNLIGKMMPKLKKHLDKQEIYSSLYTMKWFFQCFLDRTPFPLTLRLWDIYILEGERILTAMSYTTLKLHKAAIKKMEMEGIVNFLQEKLQRDFLYDHDVTIESLKSCMSELRRNGMDRPPSPTNQDEDPKKEFGASLDVELIQTPEKNNPEKNNISNGDINKNPPSGNKSATSTGNHAKKSPSSAKRRSNEKRRRRSSRDNHVQPTGTEESNKMEVIRYQDAAQTTNEARRKNSSQSSAKYKDVIKWKKVSDDKVGDEDGGGGSKEVKITKKNKKSLKNQQPLTRL